MLSKVVRLLLIEDSAEDAELILREIKRAGLDVSHERVDTEAALEAALQKTWDIVISDFSMPQFDGHKAFEIVKGCDPEVPFIFVSGVLGEDRAVEAMRAGAKDYVLKGKLDRLGPVLNRELVEAGSRRKRTEVEHALQIEQRRYQSIFNSAAVALLEVDLSGTKEVLDSLPAQSRAESLLEDVGLVRRAAKRTRILAANAAAACMLDAEGPEQLVGPLAAVLRPGSDSGWLEGFHALVALEGTFQKELQIESLEGRMVDVLLAFRVPSTPEAFANVVLSMTDISERNSLERQMRSAQRMEAVGRLAGGVAHDFNNVLTVIQSYAGFLQDEFHEQDPARKDIETIRDAAERAARLTSQLLAFSRRQVQRLEIINLNESVSGIDKMLRRLIGEDIDVSATLADDLGLVKADPTQIEQIVMNLAINARDAMPEGGKLTIETGNVDLDEIYGAAKNLKVSPGSYVMLAITDTGTGIDEETQLHVFEPFFTTKEEGKGTGLGLSTVYGIVKQSGGHIWVYSELGKGTTFKVCFPRVEDEARKTQRRRIMPAVTGGSETILLVEDEELVRKAARRILERQGYQVLEAAHGGDALLLVESHNGRIHLLLTDIVMPEISGRRLVERLRPLRPNMKVVYMSGYADNAIVHHGVLDEDAVYVQKPFSPESLLQTVREVLDAQ